MTEARAKAQENAESEDEVTSDVDDAGAGKSSGSDASSEEEDVDEEQEPAPAPKKRRTGTPAKEHPRLICVYRKKEGLKVCSQPFHRCSWKAHFVTKHMKDPAKYDDNEHRDLGIKETDQYRMRFYGLVDSNTALKETAQLALKAEVREIHSCFIRVLDHFKVSQPE